MKANWSLVLNVVLLLGVFFAITRLILIRKKDNKSSEIVDDNSYNEADDIIAVRKLDSDDSLENQDFKLSPAGRGADNRSARKPSIESGYDDDNKQAKAPALGDDYSPEDDIEIDTYVENNSNNSIKEAVKDSSNSKNYCNNTIMLFLSAKEHHEFAGYDLLQSLLAAGLRFGEGNIFHKYQKANGQGAVLFSLAAATQTGTFDLQTMGSYSVRGLCMYMHLSGVKNIDTERFDMMCETAKSLSEDLGAKLLDDKQNIFSSAKSKYINGK